MRSSFTGETAYSTVDIYRRLHPRMARSRGGRCGGLRGAKQGEGGPRPGERRGGASEGTGRRRGRRVGGFCGVCARDRVRAARRQLLGDAMGFRRPSRWRSAPSSLYSRSSRPTASSASSSLFTHLPAAPANAFEGSYFPPGVFSAQRGLPSAAHQLHRPQSATHASTSLPEGYGRSPPRLPRVYYVGSQRATLSKSSAQWSKTMVDFPPAAVNANAFAAAFKGRFFFEAGQHRFVIAASGGFRLFVDSVLVIDELSLDRLDVASSRWHTPRQHTNCWAA